MPLFHSLACSLQLKVHSETRGGTKTHAQMNASTHPTLARGLKHFHPRASSYSAVTFCPDMSLKSVPGSGGVIPIASKWAVGTEAGEAAEWWAGAGSCKLSSLGGWLAENFLLWHDGSSLVHPCPPLAAGTTFWFEPDRGLGGISTLGYQTKTQSPSFRFWQSICLNSSNFGPYSVS